MPGLGGAKLKFGESHRAALALPAIKKTGNYAVDSEQERAKEELAGIINGCIRDTRHISPLFAMLQKRIKSYEVTVGLDMFEAISTLGKLPMDFIVQYLEQVSDLSVTDIVKTLSFDSDIPLHLLLFDQQLPASFKLPRECRLREVMSSMLMWRSKMVGSRLAKIKHAGGLLDSGKISWKKVGCYSLLFEGDKLSQVLHISGEVASVSQPAIVHTDWQLFDNYSDVLANVVKEPLPPFKLSIFFDEKKRQGPFGVQAVNPKQYGEKAKDYEKEYTEKRSVQSHVVTQSVTADALAAMDKTRHAEGLKRAREQAVVGLAKKKVKRTTSLT